ncbi:MAG: hypothetical protein KDC98_14575 [Planctomycetes bacterium]|nr:hypothetical protein [Planctomycetota bacterium]
MGHSKILLAHLALLPMAIAQHPMDDIDADYRNVHGVNFIPTFTKDSTTDIGVLVGATNPNLIWNDTASPAAAWKAYALAGPVATDIQLQLSRIRDVGFNTVRVWLSYHYWRFQPTIMHNKFVHFLGLCQSEGLHVKPVVWDNDFVEPDPTSLAGGLPDYYADYNYANWIRSPGTEVINSRGGFFVDDDPEAAFILDMLDAAYPYMKHPQDTDYAQRTLLVWDVMNEPLFDSNHMEQFNWITTSLELIKAFNDGRAQTAVTPAVWNYSDTAHRDLARNPNLDVLGFNFYGNGPRDIERKCDNARFLLTAFKPVIAMEAGLVGWGQTYPEAINLATKVPSTYTGNPGGDGIGFCLFSANVGKIGGPDFDPTTGTRWNVNFIAWHYGDGLFYGPQFDAGSGSSRTVFVRDYGVGGTTSIQPTIQAMASFRTWSLSYTYASMPTNDPAHPEYEPPPRLRDGTNRSHYSLLVANAATLTSGPNGCGLLLQDPALVIQELWAAENMATWSLQSEYGYRLSATVPNGYVLQTSSATAQALASAAFHQAKVLAALHQGVIPWATMQYDYQQLFLTMHNFWAAGAFNTWYP